MAGRMTYRNYWDTCHFDGAKYTCIGCAHIGFGLELSELAPILARQVSQCGLPFLLWQYINYILQFEHGDHYLTV